VLYAIVTEGRFIKFGYAKNPARRLSELQVGSPFELILLATLALPDEWFAQEVERYVHVAAAKYHVRGEWFRSSPKTLMVVEWMKRGPGCLEAMVREAAHAIEREASAITHDGVSVACAWPENVRTKIPAENSFKSLTVGPSKA
jgi:hypothetical protein